MNSRVVSTPTRLDRLEREVRSLLEVTGAETTVVDEVRAKRLVLVDDNNKPTALFGVVDGGVRLELNDRQGELRVLLTISEDGRPVLALLGSHGKGGIALGLASDGSSGLEISDQQGQVRSELTTTADGVTRLAVLDKGGNPRGALGLSPEGTTQLVLYDGSKSRAALSVEQDGSPTLRLYDSEGKPGCSIQCAGPRTPAPRS